MKKISFVNNKIINNHFKIHWKIVLFYALTWSIIAIGLSSFSIIDRSYSGGRSFISNYYYSYTYAPEPDYNTSSSSSGRGMCMYVGQMIYNVIGIPILLGVSFSLAIILISKEIKSGKITLWMTTSSSKVSILLSKLCFIWATILITIAPSGVYIIILAATIASDAHENLVYIVLAFVYFTLFILFMSTVFATLSVLLSDINAVELIVGIFIIGYVVVTSLINMMYDAGLEIKWMKYVKYFSIESLMAPTLNFEDADTIGSPFIGSDDTTAFYIGKIIINKGWVIASPFVNIALAIGFTSVATTIFAKKNINI